MGSSTYIGQFMDYQIFKIEESRYGELCICYEAINKEQNGIYTTSFEDILAVVTKIQKGSQAYNNFYKRLI